MTAPHEQRHIRLRGAHNVRDLGGYPTLAGGTVPWRTFLRADSLHDLQDEDIDTLLSLGLRTVIDLRSAAEIAHQPSRLAALPAIRYHHIALFDGLAPVDRMLTGLPAGTNLSARYIAALDGCQPAMMKVARIIAEAEDGAVLFNCTAGKDRTGIVAAMLLSLAGVAPEEIIADYALTGTLASALMTRLRTQAVTRGLDEAQATLLLSSEPAAMHGFLAHVEEAHGGFAQYLSRHPEAAAVVERVTRRMATRATEA